jgi:hypothetical protein
MDYISDVCWYRAEQKPRGGHGREQAIEQGLDRNLVCGIIMNT